MKLNEYKGITGKGLPKGSTVFADKTLAMAQALAEPDQPKPRKPRAPREPKVITILDIPELAGKYEKYANKYYAGNYSCDEIKITSLKGAPNSVKGFFSCYNTNIKSLRGAPSAVGGYFDCSYTDITSLEGAPKTIGKDFYCTNTKIVSFHDIHKQINHIGGVLYINGTVNHLLGILLIDGIKGISITDIAGSKSNPARILNYYLKNGRDIFACQEELIDAGYAELAQL